MIQINIAGPTHFEEMAAFIATHNATPSQHHLHCGQSKKEVWADLKDYHSRNEERFLLAFKNDQLIGLIGGDSDHNPLTEIWLWGPFVDQSAPTDLKQLLFNQLRTTFPTIKKMTAFYNIENTSAQSFYQQQGFKEAKEATHEYVCLQNNYLQLTNLVAPKTHKAINYTPSYLKPLQKLHEKAFPKTYYTVDEMIKLQSETYKLWLIVSSNQLIAYIFCNITPSNEGFIHFLAVDEQYRKQGLGSTLLQKALLFFFKEKKLKSTYLTVSDTNNARNLYEKHGFSLRYTGKGAFMTVD